MAAVFGPPGPTLSRSALVHDPFDREAFEEVLPWAPGLRLLLETSTDLGTKDLAFDLFCSFYKYFVKLLPADQVIEECRGHRDLLDRALGLREHEKLRAWTRLKSAETALATELVLDLLLIEPTTGPEKARAPTPEAGTSPEDATATDASTERLREVLRDVREDLEGAVELVAAWSAGPGDETPVDAESGPESAAPADRPFVRPLSSDGPGGSGGEGPPGERGGRRLRSGRRGRAGARGGTRELRDAGAGGPVLLEGRAAPTPGLRTVAA